MFRHYEKTFRILVPQISTKGKHYLSDADTKKLLGGQVHVFEKLDGANTGIIRHKDYFKLQKRGSLVDTSEHYQFNYFKAWSQVNYDKLMQIPKDHILYGELMVCKHTIFYDKLPDYFIPFGLFNKKSNLYYHYDDLRSLCDNIGLATAPLVGYGNYNKSDLFNLIPNPSKFSSNTAEGVVVWNYNNQMRGKVVRSEFQKEMDDSDHWAKKPVVNNLLEKKDG